MDGPGISNPEAVVAAPATPVPTPCAAVAPDEPSALRSASAHVRFWLVAAGGLALDLWSKYEAFHLLRQGGSYRLIPGVLEFHTTMNPGAVFGIGAGQTHLFLGASVLALLVVLWMFAQSPARRWGLHLALGAILAGALGNMYDRINIRLVPYAMPTAAGMYRVYCEPRISDDGAWIELYEYPPHAGQRPIRIAREGAGDVPEAVGCVRDFIKISQTWFGGRDVWPWVFNVADMLLVCGVGVLAIRMLFERPPQAPPQTVLDGEPRQT